jgi:ABC-type transport system involved in multi-copper enzyme maturation permease subunit
MTRLLRAELLKLTTTRLLLWLGLLIVALEVLVIALHVAQDQLDSLAQPNSQRDVVSIAAAAALISLILGIVASTGEFVHGTISHTFLVSPVRERVAAAKVLVVALVGALLAALAAVFAWVFAALLLALRSVPNHLSDGGTVRLLLATILAAAITGALGVGFGSLLRRQTAAIVIALIWLLIGEPLLAIAHVDRYGPGHAVASVVEAGQQGSDLLGFGAGLGLALLYAGGAAVLGAISLKRADI